jgi:two-component system, LytTR family, sensor kinase
MNLRNPVVQLCIFLVYSAIGVFFALHYYLDDVTWHRYGTAPVHFMEELTGSYTAMLLLPLLVWVAKRFPFGGRAGWTGPLLANAAAMVVYTLAHTTLMAITRSAISPLIGIGRYDYGEMLWRYPMEAANDAVFYSLLMVIIYLIDYFVATRTLETKLAKARLENLRLQLQPHFLFNTLNAISAVMYEDVAKADRMLAQLSDFMRSVLASGGVEEVTLEDELRIERMYVDIMKTRLERNLTLDVRVADDAHATMVPFMLLQPLLENSIKHGMGSARTSIDVAIDVTRSNGSTVIRVSDNGLGFDAARPGGIGLANITARLSSLYGDRAHFDIAARDGGGTLVTVELPASETQSCR